MIRPIKQKKKISGEQKKCSLDTIGNNLSLHKNRDITLHDKFVKRARLKSISKTMNYSLMGMQNSPLIDDYIQGHKCGDYLFQNGNKVTTNHCKKRNCMQCSRIKSKQLLDDYAIPLLNLKDENQDLYLVTLTNVNVSADELDDEVKHQVRCFTKIKNNIRKSKKYSHLKMNGYRSMECTYNEFTKFNPHIHLIVSGKEVAEEIIRQWLVLNPTANRKGQNAIEMYGGDKGLVELFKYIAKPITNGYYNAKSYDCIMRAYKGVRVYQPFGSIRALAKNDSDELDEDRLKAQIITWKESKIDVWKWIDDTHNWVNSQGELFLNCDTTDSKQLYSLNVIKNSENYDEDKTDYEKIIRDARPKKGVTIPFG